MRAPQERRPRRAGCGGAGAAGRPPRRAQGRSPEHGDGIASRPRRDQIMCGHGGRSGRGGGGQTPGHRTGGKPPEPLTATRRASRKKTERSDNRCAERSESPGTGRAARRAGRSRPRSPTRATRGTREKPRPTRRAMRIGAMAIMDGDAPTQGYERPEGQEGQDATGPKGRAPRQPAPTKDGRRRAARPRRREKGR